jgi:uncharacterized protein YecT (DUF1311 family)
LKFASSLLAVMLSASVSLPTQAQTAPSPRYGPEYQACAALPTQGIVECVAARTKEWDAKLTAAYQALMGQQSSDAQRNRLRAAQRLWIQYRDANCGYYAAGEGSISRVEAAECMRSMTEARARELTEAGQR